MSELNEAFQPDPDMSSWDLETLRVLNGETVEGWVGGAAANVACSWLKGRGYAQGHYEISAKGRAYLAALSAAAPSPGGLEREAVARVIDPMAMRSLDEWVADRAAQRARLATPEGGWLSTPESAGRAKWEVFSQPRADALAKADAILALSPPSPSGEVVKAMEIYRKALEAIRDVSTDLGAQDEAATALSQAYAELSGGETAYGTDIAATAPSCQSDGASE